MEAAIPVVLLTCLAGTMWWAWVANRKKRQKVDSIMRRWPDNEDESP